MTVIFVANTANEVGGVSFSTDDVEAHDPDYASEDIRFNLSDNSSSIANLAFSSNETDVWFHFRVHTPATQFSERSTADGYWLYFMDQDNNTCAGVDILNGRLYLEVQGNEEPNPIILQENTTYTIDIHVEISGSDMTISFYTNEVLDQTHTAGRGSATAFSGVRLEHNDMSRFGGYVSYSEFLAATVDTRGMRVCTMLPSADGTETDFDGDYTALLSPFDANSALGFNNGDISTFEIENYSGAASPSSIDFVVLKHLTRKGSSGPQNAKPVVRVGSTNYEGSQFSPENEFGLAVWDENPDTNAGWTVSDVNALEIGMKAET